MTLFGRDFLTQSRTLRECVFARLIVDVAEISETAPTLIVRSSVTSPRDNMSMPQTQYDLPSPGGIPAIADLLRLVQASAHAGLYDALPFVAASMQINGNPELHPCLQELAELVAYECSGAYTERYYPRPVGVEPLSTSHVHEIMVAMGREQEREGKRRHLNYAVFTDLPQERQVALAERRRMWFAKFGITPETWKGGTFSLWDVADEPIPSLIGGHPVVRTS